MRAASSSWARESVAILKKDLAVEFRTRYALSAVMLFALTTLMAVSFTTYESAAGPVKAALLWLVLLFAALTGLARGFVAEEDGRTADSLRLAAGPTAVFLGKFGFNLLLMYALAAVLVPGFVVLMDVHITQPLVLVMLLLCGCWALAAVLTFTAALVSRARSRGALAAVLGFPLTVPLLVLAIRGTAAAFDEATGGWDGVRGLVSYAGIMSVVALSLFEVVWNA